MRPDGARRLAVGGQPGGVAGIEWLPARLAHHRRHEAVPAVMLDHHRRAVLTGEVLVTPAHQRGDDRVQVASGARQPVFEARRVFGVLAWKKRCNTQCSFLQFN